MKKSSNKLIVLGAAVLAVLIAVEGGMLLGGSLLKEKKDTNGSNTVITQSMNQSRKAGDSTEPDQAQEVESYHMKLEAYENDVRVTRAAESLEIYESMPLGDGYGMNTGAASYAWINADDVKTIKMDEESGAELSYEDKHLTIRMTQGNTLFCVCSRLDEEEEMHYIMPNGVQAAIKGTTGIWQVESDSKASLTLLEGTVECTLPDGLSLTLTTGEYTSFSVTTDADGNTAVAYTRREINSDDIPDFAQDEIEHNDTIRQKISAEGGALSYASPYAEVLKGFYYDHVDADGWPLDYVDGMGTNSFAIADVNGDGSNELIVSWESVYNAGMMHYIIGYRYDENNGSYTYETLLSNGNYGGFEFYDNGLVDSWERADLNRYLYNAEKNAYDFYGLYNEMAANGEAEIMIDGEFHTGDLGSLQPYVDQFESLTQGARELSLTYYEFNEANLALFIPDLVPSAPTGDDAGLPDEFEPADGEYVLTLADPTDTAWSASLDSYELGRMVDHWFESDDLFVTGTWNYSATEGSFDKTYQTMRTYIFHHVSDTGVYTRGGDNGTLPYDGDVKALLDQYGYNGLALIFHVQNGELREVILSS